MRMMPKSNSRNISRRTVSIRRREPCQEFRDEITCEFARLNEFRRKRALVLTLQVEHASDMDPLNDRLENAREALAGGIAVEILLVPLLLRVEDDPLRRFKGDGRDAFVEPEVPLSVCASRWDRMKPYNRGDRVPHQSSLSRVRVQFDQEPANPCARQFTHRLMMISRVSLRTLWMISTFFGGFAEFCGVFSSAFSSIALSTSLREISHCEFDARL